MTVPAMILTVVIADDLTQIRRAVRRMLNPRRFSYEVLNAAEEHTLTVQFNLLEAENSIELEELCYNNVVDGIFTDVEMPGGDEGPVAIKRIEQYYKNEGLFLPITVVHSGQNDSPWKEFGRQRGGFLEKPFTPQQVTTLAVQMIEAVLKRRS